MKTILSNIYAFFENVGKVRAATYYTRMGDYESARKVMQS